MSRPTRGPVFRCPVRGCHPLWPAVPGGSGSKNTSRWPGPRSLATTSGVSWRLLSQTTVLMSFPPATEMFQFAGFASRTYRFSSGYPRIESAGGLPHSEIPGSTIARISPGLFAASRVRPRLSVPRHPPDALHSRFSSTRPPASLPAAAAAPNGKRPSRCQKTLISHQNAGHGLA